MPVAQAQQPTQDAVYDVSVLCVEDEPVTMHYFTKIVAPLVKELYTAGNGREGVLAYAKHKPDIVITDIMMPKMDGISMAKCIQEMQQDVRIIIATAFENIDFLKEAIELGVISYLSKPLDHDALLDVLNRTARSVLHHRELAEQKRLNETMVQSMPVPAILFERADHSVVTYNDSARAFMQAWEDLLQSPMFKHLDQPTEGQKDVFDSLPLTKPLRTNNYEAYDRIWDLSVRRVHRTMGLFTAVDITYRVHTERELRKSKEFSSAILENSFDGIAVANPNGAFKFLSPGMLRIFGYPSPEPKSIQETLSALIPDNNERDAMLEYWRHDTAKPSPPERILRFVLEDGSIRWMRQRMAHMPDGNLVINGQDITRLKEAEERVKHLAMHDSLTDLPNRQLLTDRLALAVSQAKRRSSIIALLFVDLDGFKIINDTLGHAQGDEVLREAAARLKSSIRDADTVARIGGDEFVILCPDLHEKDETDIICNRIISSFAESIPTNSGECSLGASIGVSLFPRDGENPDALLSHADTAMYAAKRKGGNTYHFYHSELG